MPSNETSPGHRKRLRKKFVRSGLGGFHDYEIVELLLSLDTPRKDCKQQAKEAIRRFKTLRGVLEAPLGELQEIDGIGPHSAFGIKLVQEVAREFLSAKIIDYLYHSMRDLRKEVFKVIYLNSQNQIIDTADLFEGTVDGSVISPREVMEGAIRHNAVSLIFVHNHPPLGDPTPSKSDKQLTRDLVFMRHILQIQVLDHIIIGENRFFSFADEGLIEKYEDSFLNLRIKSLFNIRPHSEKLLLLNYYHMVEVSR